MAGIVLFFTVSGHSTTLDQRRWHTESLDAVADRREQVARVYETLPELAGQLAGDRKECVIFAGTYHEAGAIDFLGKAYGLPPARSYFNNYYLWGPGDTSWDVVIAVRVPKSWPEDMFGEIVEAGRTSCEYTNPLAGNDEPVYVCRKPRRPIAEVWAQWTGETHPGKRFD